MIKPSTYDAACLSHEIMKYESIMKQINDLLEEVPKSETAVLNVYGKSIGSLPYYVWKDALIQYQTNLQLYIENKEQELRELFNK